jgi:hypothetical protein
MMSATLNNATVSYRSMNSSSHDFKTKSKSLINQDDDDKNEPENSGSLTVNNTTGNFTVNS